ncbi:hypothetical protein ZWY2020_039913 [Hordeum vulgare]|nr:hypothetical protein ZWY2020_039913 [Hordeum vulgare]
MITATDNPMGDASGGRRTSGWRLCKVQQVEDLKSVLGVFPLWSSGIMISVSIGVMIGMIILQARHGPLLGPRFKIPAGSITVCSLVAFIAITPVLTVLSSCLAQDHRHAAVPAAARGARPRREHYGHGGGSSGGAPKVAVVHAHDGADGEAGWVTPMSVLWLLLPLGVVGIGEALHFPGNMAFYYLSSPRRCGAYDGHGAAAHRHGVLPQHSVRRRGETGHRMAAGEHKPGEAGQRVLDTGCGGDCELWLFPHLCQPISVSNQSTTMVM